MWFYNRTHSTSHHRSNESNTTTTKTGGSKGTTPVTIYDNISLSNYNTVSDDTVQTDNLTSDLVDPDPDGIIFEQIFLSPIVGNGTWMGSVGN